MKLWTKIFLALALGVITGAILGPQAEMIFTPIGNSFLKLLNMLIVPLIFSSMVTGITNIPGTRELGRIGATTLALYAFTTAVAISLGLFLATSCPIGSLLTGSIPEFASQPVAIASNHSQSSPPLTLQEMILGAIPKNPIKAFYEQNVLQIIVFAMFFGIALNLSGERGRAVKELMESISFVMQRLTSLIMKFSPIGVFCLMAAAVGNMGLMLLIPVSLFLLMYYLACLTHTGVVFCGLLRGVGQLPILPFFKGTKEVFATAISTCSSSASLPVAMQCVTERLGVSKGLANFVLPLGCSLNMNGSALFQTMAAIFIAQAYGIDLSIEALTTLSFTVLFATIGTASIPGAGFMMLSIVFSSIGVPLEGLALLAGIDRLRDMGTTTLNILGDSVCAVVVASREGELNMATYLSSSEDSIEPAKVLIKK